MPMTAITPGRASRWGEWNGMAHALMTHQMEIWCCCCVFGIAAVVVGVMTPPLAKQFRGRCRLIAIDRMRLRGNWRCFLSPASQSHQHTIPTTKRMSLTKMVMLPFQCYTKRTSALMVVSVCVCVCDAWSRTLATEHVHVANRSLTSTFTIRIVQCQMLIKYVLGSVWRSQCVCERYFGSSSMYRLCSNDVIRR